MIPISFICSVSLAFGGSCIVLGFLTRFNDGLTVILDSHQFYGILLLVTPSNVSILLLQLLLDYLVPLALEEIPQLRGFNLQFFEFCTRLISRLLGLVCLSHNSYKLLPLALNVRLKLPVYHVKHYSLLSELVDPFAHAFVLGDGLIVLLELCAETVLEGLDLLRHARGVGIRLGKRRFRLSVTIDVHLDLIDTQAETLQNLLLLLYLLRVTITELQHAIDLLGW